jgi:predicted permease
MIERIRSELLTACRSLLATPVPVAAAVVTLAVAVGVNLAMFGLVGRALLNPPAHVSEPERVFTVGFNRSDDAPGATAMTTTSFVTFASIRDRVPALSGAAAFQRDARSAVIDGEQRQVNAMLVTGAYFELLGARPLVGRGILPAQDDAGAAEPVAVLSYSFWRSAFGGDRGVVGRRLSVGGLDYAVAGVMPEGFSGHSATDVDLWVPFAAAMRNSPGWDREAFRNFLSVVVRLAPGGILAAAEAQAGTATGRRVTMSAIVGAEVAATEQRVAWWLTGVSVLVLVIGLANAATLLVARAAKRRHDFAIRAALGASRGRLIVQAFAEAGVLAVASTAASLVLAPSLDEAVRRVLFPGVIGGGSPGGATVMTAAIAGVMTALVATAANLWQLPSKADPWSLSAAGRTGGRRARTITGLLLVQTMLSVLLLSGAAMFGNSFYKLAAQDFGMKMDGVVLVEFEPGPGGLAGEAELFSNAIEQVRAMPGVQMVTVIDAIPFGGFNVPPISVPGHAEPPNVGGQLPRLTAATPEYLKILGVQVVEGRAFTDADGRGALVVIVNQAMARGVWPGESAVGKCIRIGFDPDFDPETAVGPPVPSAAVPCREVIGVSRDVRQRSLVPVNNEARLMEYYVPFAQVPKPPFAAAEGPPVRGLLLRASAGADALATPIRHLIVGPRTDLPYLRVQPYVQLLDRQMRPWKLATTLLVWFSALALGVAAVGLYAAFAHAVGERRREMAIRLAIGARPGGVLTMVLREALALASVGVVCGWVAAGIAGRWVQSLLFGTAPSDPIVLASAAAVMLLVAAGATLVPARAASRVDPNVLLRVD